MAIKPFNALSTRYFVNHGTFAHFGFFSASNSCTVIQVVKTTTNKYAPIAQLDRASVYGTEGQGFESLWAHKLKIPTQMSGNFFMFSPAPMCSLMRVAQHQLGVHNAPFRNLLALNPLDQQFSHDLPLAFGELRNGG